jgi:hypothetical protein
MGLLDSAPFLPAARPPRINSNCTYVDATQH